MAKYIAELETEINNIPCVIGVIEYTPYRSAYIYGPPENCYPEEGGESVWELLKVTGQPYKWLDNQLSDSDIEYIENKIFNYFEYQVKENNIYDQYIDSDYSYR